MKYWWLKKYKDIKLDDIDNLIRDVNYYIVMPKDYVTRYSLIKNSDINKLMEEDLIIYLYCLLKNEKINSNNKLLLIINRLLEFPDTSMPSTNYSLSDMLDEINNLRVNYPIKDKLLSNNIAACYHCYNVFYIDSIKYINKKGYCLCPYCKSHTIYFDNDFMPMDYNYLRLAHLFLEYTSLGCRFYDIQLLLKKIVHIKNGNILDNLDNSSIFILCDNLDNHDNIYYLDSFKFKKKITSKEEMMVMYSFNEIFNKIEDNMNSRVAIDLNIFKYDKNYQLTLSFLINLMDFLGRNPYIKDVYLYCDSLYDYKNIKEFIKTLIHYGEKVVN